MRTPTPTPLTRRQFGVTAAAVLGGLGLAACGPDAATRNATSGTLLFYNDNPEWKDGFLAAGRALRPTTGFDFKPLVAPSLDAYSQLIKASLETNKAADVAKWHEAFPLQQLARTNRLADLSDIWDELETKGWVDPERRSSFTTNGKAYGLPMVQSYWLVFYSKPLFAKAGVEPPTTYEQFLEVAADLKKVGTTPIWTGQGDGWESFVPYVTLIAAQSPDEYLRLTSNRASYTDEVPRRAMELWRTWIQRDWVTPPDSKLADAAGLMKAGKLAMLPVGSWFNGTLKGAGLKPGTDYGAFLFPTIDDAPQSVFVENSALIVPRRAPHLRGAVEQMRHWLDPAAQQGWAEFIGDNSANPTVTIPDPVLKLAGEQITKGKVRKMTRYFEASPPDLVNGNIQDLSGFMIDPSSASRVAASMRARAKQEWAAWEADGS